MMGSVWYLDHVASFHMTRNKENSSDLEEKDLQMHNEMGYGGRYSAIGIGTINFQRDSDSPLTSKDIIYVPGLNKNLVSVVMLEYCAYDVIFRKGKAFPTHIIIEHVKHIGVRGKNC